MRKENIKKHKFNLMDVFVILLVLACLCSVILRATSDSQQEYETKECRLYFQIDDIKSSSYSFFEGHAGETVRTKSDCKILGKLGGEFSRGVAIYTYTENVEDGTQNEKHALYPAPENGALYRDERCSVVGYIVVQGNCVNNGILFEDGSFIALGQTFDIITEYIETSIRITGVSEK